MALYNCIVIIIIIIIMYLDSRVSVFYCRYFYFLFTAKIKKVTEFVVGHDFLVHPVCRLF